jgi:hypothetical protein
LKELCSAGAGVLTGPELTGVSLEPAARMIHTPATKTTIRRKYGK